MELAKAITSANSYCFSHLIEHDSLLRAGGDKTLVVFAETYHNFSREFEPDGYFVNLWKRHGLYQLDEKKGIVPVKVSKAWRFVHFERNRVAGCLNRLGVVFHETFRERVHGDDLKKKPDAEISNKLWCERMGPDWRRKISDEIQEFQRIVEYLQVRGVRVAVILLPVGSCEDHLPFERTFISEMAAVCEAKRIPLYDWSRALSDTDMQDASHANVFGAEKLQPAFLEIALPFLRSTQALSAAKVSSYAGAAH